MPEARSSMPLRKTREKTLVSSGKQEAVLLVGGIFSREMIKFTQPSR